MNEPAGNPVSRLVWLLVALVSLLSVAFVLPRNHAPSEAAIRMILPPDVSFWCASARSGGDSGGPLIADSFQHWKGYPMEISAAEHSMLASDTEFEKRNYLLTDPQSDRPAINGWLSVQASIVLSGHDLNDSIHRPERCLPAQGYKELKLSRLAIRTPSGDVPISRISCYLEKSDETTGKVLVGSNGAPIRIRHVFYYWFVGTHSLTASHYDRTLTDMKDRLLGGYEQRWAYVLLGGAVTDNLVGDGLLAGDPTYPRGRSEAETDSLLQKLVEAVSRETIQWDRIRR